MSVRHGQSGNFIYLRTLKTARLIMGSLAKRGGGVQFDKSVNL
jgi:hypothetical protein